MKTYLIALALFIAAVVAIPAVPAAIYSRAAEKSPPAVSEAAQTVPTRSGDEKAAVPATSAGYTGTPYKILDVSTGEVIEVSEREYVIGAVCAEMPATFSDEALKAQAAAAHTYAERQRALERGRQTPELCGADLSNDTSKYQGYFTENQAKQYYGDNFDMYWSKVSAAVDEVLPYIITYEDEPIISAFHSMSAGRTESAANVWGAPVDYLVPVDSEYDLSAPKYLEETRFAADVLRYDLETAFPGIALGDDISEWLSVEKVSESGTVLTVRVGDRMLTGTDLRTALALRSACFDISYDGGEAVITTRGYGHGVGMSQYGANAMAAAGATWQEIIEHYYPSCEITALK